MTEETVSPQEFASIIPLKKQYYIFLLFILVWFGIGFAVGWFVGDFL